MERPPVIAEHRLRRGARSGRDCVHAAERRAARTAQLRGVARRHAAAHETEICERATRVRVMNPFLRFCWDGKYGIRDNYKLIISVFAAWRL